MSGAVEATKHETRVDPVRRRGLFLGYQARCSCGWCGPSLRFLMATADFDAESHILDLKEEGA